MPHNIDESIPISEQPTLMRDALYFFPVLKSESELPGTVFAIFFAYAHKSAYAKTND
ncbi:MAG: hypothetical protein K2H94_10275 [Duncaniella sp.]|nr:hypothetical protein [Duncaniella sp.]